MIKAISITTQTKYLIDGKNHVKKTMKIDGTEIKLIMDTSSGVTKLQAEKEKIKTKRRPMNRKYQDVKKNEVHFLEKLRQNQRTKEIREILNTLITVTEKIQPLLSNVWLREIKLTMKNMNNAANVTDNTKRTKFYRILKNYSVQTEQWDLWNLEYIWKWRHTAKWNEMANEYHII